MSNIRMLDAWIIDFETRTSYKSISTDDSGETLYECVGHNTADKTVSLVRFSELPAHVLEFLRLRGVTN